jgi:choloylglycine hydrolase
MSDLLLISNSLYPCSTFALRDSDANVVLGHTLDWNWSEGFLMVNPRGYFKTAILVGGGKPAKWASQYGSVTFNQFGPDLPFGGMNEKGLVVETTWLEQTRYPSPGPSPCVNLLGWVQFQLDNYATVSEVLANLSKVRIQNPVKSVKNHYFIADSAGDCAVVECLDRKMVAYTRKDLSVPVLTNDPYIWCLEKSKREVIGGGRRSPSSSLARFHEAMAITAEWERSKVGNAVDFGFEALDKLSTPSKTVWKVVYDLKEQAIWLIIAGRGGRSWSNLSDFSFSATNLPYCLDLACTKPGNISRDFKPMTVDFVNRTLGLFFNDPRLIEAFGDLRKFLPSIVESFRVTYGSAVAH